MERQLMVGVKVLLRNKQGKYLLARRNPKKYPEVGPKWDIIGGRIDVGSSLMENLKREVMEEVGLELTDTPALLAAQDILRVPDRHVVRLTYYASIEGKPVADNEENTEARWFSLSELRSMPKQELDSYLMEILHQGILPKVVTT